MLSFSLISSSSTPTKTFVYRTVKGLDPGPALKSAGPDSFFNEGHPPKMLKISGRSRISVAKVGNTEGHPMVQIGIATDKLNDPYVRDLSLSGEIH